MQQQSQILLHQHEIQLQEMMQTITGNNVFTAVCSLIQSLSFMGFFSFSSAVLLWHNQMQSICTMPVTLFL